MPLRKEFHHESFFEDLLYSESGGLLEAVVVCAQGERHKQQRSLWWPHCLYHTETEIAHVANALKYGHDASWPYEQFQSIGHMSEQNEAFVAVTHGFFEKMRYTKVMDNFSVIHHSIYRPA